MKYLMLLLLTLFLLTACNSDESEKIKEFIDNNENHQNPLLGEWILIERLSDPGDGSGTFIPVQSDKTISFKSDMTFEASEQLCVMIPSSLMQGYGSYSLDENKLFPEECTNKIELSFELVQDSLIIHYFCIEPCAEKYTMVKTPE